MMDAKRLAEDEGVSRADLREAIRGWQIRAEKAKAEVESLQAIVAQHSLARGKAEAEVESQAAIIAVLTGAMGQSDAQGFVYCLLCDLQAPHEEVKWYPSVGAIVHVPKCPLADLPAAARAHVEQEKRLEARARLGDLWEAAEANGHVVEFRTTSFGLEHPPSCRLSLDGRPKSLIDCLVNRALESFDEAPKLGRYRVRLRHFGLELAEIGETE